MRDGQLVVHTLRRALASVLASAGGDASQPQDVSRRFGVDKTLAWRVARALREEDAWEAIQHLPARAGIRIFGEAMAKAGADRDRVDHLWKALDEFEQFVETHARDRDTLDMIVSVPSRRSAEKKLEAFRRAGYQCNSSLLGVRASHQIGAHLMAPSKAVPGTVDIGVFTGIIELCRLRSRVPWPIATVKNWGGLRGDILNPSGGVFPIEESPDGKPSPLLRDLCSPRDLDVRIIEQPAGTFRYVLDAGPVGYAASVNVFSGWVNFATAEMRESTPGELGEHGINLCTPAEELVFDLLVHRDCGFASDVTALVYGQFPGGPQYPDAGSEGTTLPVPTDVLDLGISTPDSPSAVLEDYPGALQRVAARMGRTLGEFRAYRYRLRYPPIPALALLRHRLLPASR
jgi:hypothetical protein